MYNFEISVNDLKENKVKGVKIPDTLDKQVYNVQYGNTIELPISGIPNSSVVLTVLGKAEELTLVLEDDSEIKPSQDGSINKSVKSEQTDSKDTASPEPAEHTENPASPANPEPAEHTENPASPEPAEHTENPASPEPAEHTENPASPASPEPAEHTENPASPASPEPAEHTDPKASETGSETNDGRVPKPSELEGDHL